METVTRSQGTLHARAVKPDTHQSAMPHAMDVIRSHAHKGTNSRGLSNFETQTVEVCHTLRHKQ